MKYNILKANKLVSELTRIAEENCGNHERHINGNTIFHLWNFSNKDFQRKCKYFKDGKEIEEYDWSDKNTISFMQYINYQDDMFDGTLGSRNFNQKLKVMWVDCANSSKDITLFEIVLELLHLGCIGIANKDDEPFIKTSMPTGKIDFNQDIEKDDDFVENYNRLASAIKDKEDKEIK